MRRALLSWSLVFGLLAAGFGASVLALNSDLYSAHGFVRSYLETLARRDADEALDFDGVVVPAGASEALLVDSALGQIDGIRMLSDVTKGETNVVRFEYSLAGATTITEFTVERAGTRFGLFSVWRFAVSPTAILDARVDFDSRFSANGVESVAGPHAVLVPAVFVLDHESKYLTALDVGASVTEVGSIEEQLVNVAPTAAFESEASGAVAAFLDACATQQVLKPTGCPFGTDVANRLNGDPAWSMLEYPTALLSPSGERGDEPAGWKTEPADAVVNITVSVKSLFDGSLTTLDKDVTFTSSYLITVGRDDSLSVTAPGSG